MLYVKENRRTILVFLGILLLLTGAGEAGAELNTPFTVTIEMEKHTFKQNEPIAGNVVINNAAPATLPGSFEVTLYKDGEVRYTTTIFIKTIFPSSNKFQLKNFGIPALEENESTLGLWRLIIYQTSRPQDSVTQEFMVTAKDEKTGLIKPGHY